MNGRIYDPLLGRFLSADILVSDNGNLQCYNRYSYVRNNPLSLIDPSGFLDEVAAGEQLADWGSAGGALLSKMETQAGSGWTYKSFDSYTADANTGSGSVGGVTSYDNKTVYLQDKSRMSDTLDSASHETEHTTQTPFTTVDGRAANERGAYRAEAQFQIDTGRTSKFTHSVKDPVTKKSSERIDDAAIDAHLVDYYPTPNGPDGKPVPGTTAAKPSVTNDNKMDGVKGVNLHLMRLSYNAEASKIASKAAAKAANTAQKAAEKAAKRGTPEERAKTQKAADDAKKAAEDAKAAAAAAKKALEDEEKRLRNSR